MLDNISNELNKNLTTLFNVKRAIERIIKKTRPILLNLTVSSTIESLEVVDTEYIAESWFERNARISKQYSERISESINTLDENLKDDVRRSLARDASRSREQQLEDLLNDTQHKFDNYYTKSRAESIATTNTNAVDNAIKRDSWKEAGAIELEWITEGDDRVRPSHEAMDGTTTKIDSEFRIEVYDSKGNPTGEFVTAPHPAGGSTASEDVNCRCTMRPVMNN